MNIDWVLKCAANAAKTPAARQRVEEIQVHLNGYAEPGYEGEIVLLGDWNNFSEYVDGKYKCLENTMGRLTDLLDKMEVSHEWEDEWATCDDCGKLVRLSPSGYGWSQNWATLSGCERICHECIIRDHAEDYLESLEDCESSCMTIDDLDPADYGYVKILDDLESGMYGRHDNPVMIGKALREKGISGYIFKLDDSGQFSIGFSVWAKESK